MSKLRVPEPVQLFAIALGAFGGVCIFLASVTFGTPVRLPDWLGFSLFFLSGATGGLLAWLALRKPRLKFLAIGFPKIDYQAEGLLSRVEYQAVRVVEVTEFEDEGMHYFFSLTNGKTLYLTGQYLYDYAEITDDPAQNQVAKFPCARFAVKRHKTEGWCHSIEILGPYLKPEQTIPSFSKSYIQTHEIPEDGQVFDLPFDDVILRIEGRV